MRQAFEVLGEVDGFSKILWRIFEESREGKETRQEFVLGIWRNDFMLECSGEEGEMGLKQVEFNTFSVAGAVHSERVASMHRYMVKSDSYGDDFAETGELPHNSPITGIVEGLAMTRSTDSAAQSDSTRAIGVLMVVQHNNFNIADERPLEYELSNHDPSIPCFRLEWRNILKHISLGPINELIFTSPTSPSPVEISVVYWRAGY